ncbi:hypothetical protein N878_19830 [Pseudomonas sp. EGD-AK9]|nr:hypothetical protein N878_19830 [Pseudomonas sp. EGD-AK9]
MIRRRHRDDGVVEKRQKIQRHVLRHLAHDQQVVAAQAQAAHRQGMVDHREIQADFGILAAKSGEQVGNEVLGAGLHAQVELPLQRALQVRQLHVQALQAAEDVAAGALERLGRLGQVELLADVFEQRLADQLLQLANLQAHRRLGQCHLVGGAAVRAVVAHGTEHLELAQGHAQQGFTHALLLAGSVHK